jgi:hypothetical protein
MSNDNEADTKEYRLLSMRVSNNLYEQILHRANEIGGCSVSAAARYALQRGLEKEKT